MLRPSTTARAVAAVAVGAAVAAAPSVPVAVLALVVLAVMLRPAASAVAVVAIAAAVIGSTVPASAAPATTASPGGRVILSAPFPCGEKWVGNNFSSSAHKGKQYQIDFNLAGTSGHQDAGRPIVAAAAGRVTISQFMTTDGLGELVKIRHNDDSHTLYAHLQKGSRTVRVGDVVKQGQQIGKLGNTSIRQGLSSHLHFEHRRGSAESTLQPVAFDRKPYGYGRVQTIVSKNSCGKSPVPGKGHVAADDLDGRLVPDPSRHDRVDLYRRGKPVDVVCKTTGKTAYGSKVWALTGDHLYVPAAILRHDGKPGVRPNTPACKSPLVMTAEVALDTRAAKDKRSASVVDRYKAGAKVPVVCTAYGKETYNGHDTWARTAEGKWVVREYLAPDGSGLVRGVPRCDLEKTGPGTHADPVPGGRVPVSKLVPSKQVQPFIKKYESLRLAPYNDKRSNGVCTVGWGHTFVPHRPCTEAQKRRTITKPQAEALFQKDLANAARGARDLAGPVKMNQGQFDALTSMVFNLGTAELRWTKGPGGARVETEFSKTLRAGPARWDEMPKRMRKFVHDDKQYLCGLDRRRIAEAAMFMKGDYQRQVPESECTDR